MNITHDICLQGNNKFVPMPPNIQTVNMLFGTDIKKKEEMVAWLNKRRPSTGEMRINMHVFYTQILNSPSETKPKNGEEMAISRVGKDLFKMLIKVST